ncbi:MAG: RsbRD N-terminal domain-containing protein [Nitrospira sp.]|nr:RsbRD N-terminal domain-containing protein [bacterium]MBL7050246.1 RsbRD N-terminal domain-containing protein [Nitrospira sp.]
MLDPKLKDILSLKKTVVLNQWFDAVLDTFPEATAELLRKKRNPLNDPVAAEIFGGLTNVLNGFLEGPDFNADSLVLDDIMRVRAVQDFTPSRAVSFIFLLKKVVRKELAKDISSHKLERAMLKFESQIDDTVSICFDIYVKCREKIFEIKANEMKNWTYRLLQDANKVKKSAGK